MSAHVDRNRRRTRSSVLGAALAAFALASLSTLDEQSDVGIPSLDLVTRAGAAAPAAPPPAAAASDAGAPATPSAVDAGAGANTSVSGCVESIPKGAQRPIVSETFPQHGTSGWAATLAVTVHHGKGERVLPSGLDLASAVDAKKYLKQAGFAIPEQDGGAGARMWSDPDDPNKLVAVTHLELPLVTLPEGPGRNVLNLPPLPVAVARANGEIATVCTHTHTIVVDDPTANVPDAEPKPNPPPRPQREEWTALKKGLLWGGLGLLTGGVLAWFAYRWLHRPKPPPPPKPPRPPWEVALERLDEVRHAGLLEAGRHTEYYDRVSDAVRGYLGARFGFDGLESTTDEILAALKKQGTGFVRLDETEGAFPGHVASGIPLRDVARFLADCDLVKFANLTPSPEQCSSALLVGEQIVRTTSPMGGPLPSLAVPAVVEAAPVVTAPPVVETDADAQWKPPASQASVTEPPSDRSAPTSASNAPVAMNTSGADSRSEPSTSTEATDAPEGPKTPGDEGGAS